VEASTKLRVSRSSFLSRVAPGLALVALLGLAGCKDPGTASNGGTQSGGSSSATAQDTSGSDIKIGHYASLTGETATFGTESQAGIDFAVQQLNDKGGVLGKKFTVETQDDQSKPEEAATVVTKFSNDPAIVAVLGEVASGRSLRAAPILQRAGIPMISPSSTNPDVTKVGDNIFRVCYIDPFQGYVVSKFAHDDLKVGKVAIMRDPSNDYSVGLANVIKEEFTKMGGTIVADVSYNGKDSDFRSQLSQVQGAEAIFVPGYYGEVGTIARQAKEQGINSPLIGCDGWDSPKLVEGAGGPGKALEGSYFSNHYSKDDKAPRVQEFVKAYTEKNGKAPSGLAALGYDAMMLLADAIKRAGSTDRAKVREAIASTKDFPGVTGTITIDSERNAKKPAVMLQIKGNEFVYKATVDPPSTAQSASAK
jgi:branched-chain amino acid transport system substrate-binding protein